MLRYTYIAYLIFLLISMKINAPPFPSLPFPGAGPSANNVNWRQMYTNKHGISLNETQQRPSERIHSVHTSCSTEFSMFTTSQRCQLRQLHDVGDRRISMEQL
jgi:hypothetical protein